MVILSHFYNDVILNQNRFVLPWLYTPLIPNEKFKMVFYFFENEKHCYIYKQC